MFIRASRLQNGMTIQKWNSHLYTNNPVVYSNIFNVYFDEYDEGSGSYVSFSFIDNNHIRTRQIDAHEIMLLMDIIEDWMPVINAKNLKADDLIVFSDGYDIRYGPIISNTKYGDIGMLGIGNNRPNLYHANGSLIPSAAFRPNNRAAYDKWVEIITRPILD